MSRRARFGVPRSRARALTGACGGGGSDVILSLVDSAGNSGGVAPATYSITGAHLKPDRNFIGLSRIRVGDKDGSSSCLPSVPAAWPLINANTTKDLDTCQSLGARHGRWCPSIHGVHCAARGLRQERYPRVTGQCVHVGILKEANGPITW